MRPAGLQVAERRLAASRARRSDWSSGSLLTALVCQRFEPRYELLKFLRNRTRVLERQACARDIASRSPSLPTDLALDKLAESETHGLRSESQPKRAPDLVADLNAGHAIPRLNRG